MSNKIEVDTKTFVRFWLVILGLGLVALFIWTARVGLLLVGISLFLAIAILPLAEKIARIFKSKKGKKWPVAVAYISIMAVLVVILSVVVPVVVNETVKFVQNLPDMVEAVSGSFGWLNDIGDRFGLENLEGQIVSGVESFSGEFMKDFGTNIITSVGAAVSVMAAAGIVLVLTFLMMVEGPDMMEVFWAKHEDNKKVMRAKRILSRMADVIAKFVSRYLLISLFDGMATALAVFILALVFGFSPGLALPFGLITGVLSLIPMFGPIIGGALVGVLMAFSNLWAALIFVVYFIVYMQIEANIITPRVQGKGLKMPALVVLLSVTVGMYMFGLLGAIIAIPIAGCVKVLLEEYGPNSHKKSETKKIEENATA